MKIIQAIIVIFAVVGCLALALGGYFIYNMSTKGGDNLLEKIKAARASNPAAEETTAPAVAAVPANSEYAKIIKQYQPTPTPAPAQPVAGAPVAAAPGAVPPAPVAVASAPATQAQKPIKTPKPDEGKIRDWPTGRKWVALTYDDGPHQEWTPKMIELLRSKNVKATFYLLGQEIERFPDVAKSIADNGFEIGNHTMNHKDQNSLSVDEIRKQLSETNALIAEHVTKEPVRTMRPPYGNTPKKLVEVCSDMGLSIVCWNIDTDDWRSSTDAKKMAETIMKNVKDGAIILMHDKHQKTYDTTAEVIDKIRAEGYEFVTMSEMLGFKPYTPPGAAPAVAAAPAQAAPVQDQAVNAAAAPPQPAAAPAQQPAAEAAPGTQGLPPVSPAASGAGSLPVPSQVTPVPAIDESKITQPPPQR